jgi:C_GCAxxG_C_C family probable redox protein
MFEEVAQKSTDYFKSGLYCAESVLLAVTQHKGIRSKFIPKIATGFCSGISRTTGMCGAVSGAILAINIFFGRNSPEESVEQNYKAVNNFIELFEKKFGSTNCEKLIDCDLGTEEGQTYFEKNNLIERCQLYTRLAAKMAMEVIKT